MNLRLANLESEAAPCAGEGVLDPGTELIMSGTIWGATVYYSIENLSKL